MKKRIKYRIKQEGTEYYPEVKCLWFWYTLPSPFHNAGYWTYGLAYHEIERDLDKRTRKEVTYITFSIKDL